MLVSFSFPNLFHAGTYLLVPWARVTKLRCHHAKLGKVVLLLTLPFKAHSTQLLDKRENTAARHEMDKSEGEKCMHPE